MYAEQGDWLVIKGPVVGKADLRGHILEVRGSGGTPPYLVRWLDNGHVGLVFPGPDATVLCRAEHDAEVEQERVRLSRLQRELAGRTGV